jgi:hypothetical protein
VRHLLDYGRRVEQTSAVLLPIYQKSSYGVWIPTFLLLTRNRIWVAIRVDAIYRGRDIVVHFLQDHDRFQNSASVGQTQARVVWCSTIGVTMNCCH